LQQWTSICPSKIPPYTSLVEAAYKSFQNGFESGYYLIINMAVGGNGVLPAPDKNNFPATEMKIAQVKRYVINDVTTSEVK
jgi:hypothetical protein